MDNASTTVARITVLMFNVIILMAFIINVSTERHVKKNVNDREGYIEYDNRTKYDYIHDNKTDYLDYNVSKPSPRPDLWCPNNYDLFQNEFTGSWFQVCKPSFCVDVSHQENYTDQFETDNVKLVINHNSTMAQLCVRKLSKTFWKCSKLYIEKSEYEILANGKIWNIPRDYIFPLGDFFIYGNNTAAVCDPTSPSQTNAPSPPWCLPLSFAENEFRMDPNETVHISKLALNVSRDYYSLRAGRSNVNVCIPLDPEFQSCAQVMFVPLDEYERNENFDLVNKFYDHSYKFRHYFLADDRTQFAICIETVAKLLKRPQLTRYRYLYAFLSAISAFCLFLVLVSHTMFPTLNYHTKGLLCLVFGFMVMYICMSARYFSVDFIDFDKPAEHVIMFSFQYIFGMSAFFWHSVLGFEVWRAFSHMSATTTSGQTQKEKLIFIAKCLYAWGIPVIMWAVDMWTLYRTRTLRTSERYNPSIVFILYEDGWPIGMNRVVTLANGPILLLLIINLIFFILTIINIRRSSSGTDILNKNINRKLLRVYFKIFLVMGLTWLAEIITGVVLDHVDRSHWYKPDLINCFQGVLLFIIYVCNKKTLKVIKFRLGYGTSHQTS